MIESVARAVAAGLFTVLLGMVAIDICVARSRAWRVRRDLMSAGWVAEYYRNRRED
jgi:uncharacterized protein (DUF2062 family)